MCFLHITLLRLTPRVEASYSMKDLPLFKSFLDDVQNLDIEVIRVI